MARCKAEQMNFLANIKLVKEKEHVMKKHKHVMKKQTNSSKLSTAINRVENSAI
jgi:hypothetical protein